MIGHHVGESVRGGRVGARTKQRKYQGSGTLAPFIL
jgi:hypothetical protein